jgi:Dyp-type peroxidase family
VTATAIDLDDIQGDILRAYGDRYSQTSYVFIGIGDPEIGRAWLTGLYDGVTTAAPWSGEGPETTLNVALTRAGLEALGVPPDTVESFSTEFREGMAARSKELGDAGGESDPATWGNGLGTGAAHVLLTINAKDETALQGALAELQASLAGGGLSVVHEEHARLLGTAREHFGFGDGFSQPAIEGVNDEKAPGGGVPLDGGKWRPLALGEFILGYEDEESRVDKQRRLPSAPDAPLARSGTYMVWRKLHQDVATFRKTLQEAAGAYEHGDEAKLAAKLVGRWRNGTPLIVSPGAEAPQFDAKVPGANDFGYAADPTGHRCPLGSHVRRSNPRDALGFAGKLSYRHRMIRRGMPYGTALPEGAADDGEPRGLVFVCFNASISRQFESVQRQWLNDGNVFHLAHDTDFLLGGSAEDGKMTVQGEPPFFLAPQGPFVTTKGGEYLFVPGMTALAAIADGVAG